jgi:hypothetical protein
MVMDLQDLIIHILTGCKEIVTNIIQAEQAVVYPIQVIIGTDHSEICLPKDHQVTIWVTILLD